MSTLKEGLIPGSFSQFVETSKIPPRVRDGLFSMRITDIDNFFPGVSTGEYLRKKYQSDKWLPSSELRDSMLFAGQHDFEGLRNLTYSTIHQSSDYSLREFGYPSAGFPRLHQHMRTNNIVKTMGVVERFMEGENRRTGEPSVAHIYRTTLRTQELINHYNAQYNSGNYHSHFYPEIAELAILTTQLHDFNEDKKKQKDGTIQIGRVIGINDSRDDEYSETGIYLRREQYDPDVPEEISLIEEERININPFYIPFLVSNLQALKSDHIQAGSLMQHLESYVREQNKAISIYGVTRQVLSELPYLVKAVDRRDNQDTYFFTNTPEGVKPCSMEKLIAKAMESSELFDPLDRVLSERPIDLRSELLFIMRVLADKISENKLYSALSHAIEKPGYLPFLPTRWSKFVLSAFTPDEMYTIPDVGGLPELR